MYCSIILKNLKLAGRFELTECFNCYAMKMES